MAHNPCIAVVVVEAESGYQEFITEIFTEKERRQYNDVYVYIGLLSIFKPISFTDAH